MSLNSPTNCSRGTIDSALNALCTKCNLGFGLNAANNSCIAISSSL